MEPGCKRETRRPPHFLNVIHRAREKLESTLLSSSVLLYVFVVIAWYILRYGYSIYYGVANLIQLNMLTLNYIRFATPFTIVNEKSGMHYLLYGFL